MTQDNPIKGLVDNAAEAAEEEMTQEEVEHEEAFQDLLKEAVVALDVAHRAMVRLRRARKGHRCIRKGSAVVTCCRFCIISDPMCGCCEAKDATDFLFDGEFTLHEIARKLYLFGDISVYVPTRVKDIERFHRSLTLRDQERDRRRMERYAKQEAKREARRQAKACFMAPAASEPAPEPSTPATP
jgi:hypothetical protein